ncbi:hypothetical protein NBRC110019_24660 [Neptunitalea chrysea]|uniref:BD-FAE-like domain-containing protein n=1 Tax=Neptunitalea chrysea TaxID=1647581 RepID=A0A9W6B6F5_9FLAO|nr:alpha/beta hydrolase [Neptunitalea chrysea]GLB53425.1 hypothetical protein NBRC110019_24660 [Neptunitalea chrysea]
MRDIQLHTGILLVLLCLCSCVSHSQKNTQVKKELPPYTIQTTYEKYKEKYPFIDPIQITDTTGVTVKKNVVYHNTSTSSLCFDVYFSSVTTPKSLLPVVLLIHGGGWVVGERQNQSIMATHLAKNGYVAIPVSYSLSKEATYPAAVIDIKHAIQYIREHENQLHADGNHIAILGTSAGAQLATLVGVTPNSSIFQTTSKTSDAVQSIINIDGIVSFTHPESEEGTIAAQWLGATKIENRNIWEQASPLNYVTQHTPSILFINSSQPRFHAGRDDMITQLNSYKIYTETHTLEGAPHSFWLLHPWYEPTLSYVLAFLNKTLKHSS